MELELRFPKIFVVCTWTFIIVYIYAFDPTTYRGFHLKSFIHFLTWFLGYAQHWIAQSMKCLCKLLGCPVFESRQK